MTYENKRKKGGGGLFPKDMYEPEPLESGSFFQV